MKKTEAPVTSRPRIDLQTFWKAHDRSLEVNRPPQQVHLGHNLYRGMPAWFNAFFDHFQRKVIGSWVQTCRLQPGMTALDVGCGTGRWIGLMTGMNQRAFGVDVGFQGLRFAREQWRQAQLVQGRLPFLGFTGAIFDWAVSMTVIQHLPPEDQFKTLLEIHRLLKPGGYLLLCESIDVHDRSDHVFPHSPKEWAVQFRQAGFEILDHRGCEFIPFIKGFHWIRDRGLLKSTATSRRGLEVSSVASFLENRPVLAFLIRGVLWISYPLEALAERVFPKHWARLGCFLLRKPVCV